MSIPSLNPDRTAAGIIVDPRTLERVVPQSKRKDGSVRKELKIRPGFTPQEDVGRFRGTRQQVSDLSKTIIPGSNRTKPLPPSNPDNPFAQPPASKSKAQLKNEKRREKKKSTSTTTTMTGIPSDKNWDESDDGDDDGTGGMREAFEAVDLRRKENQEKEQEQDPVGSEMIVDQVGNQPSSVSESKKIQDQDEVKVDPMTARQAGNGNSTNTSSNPIIGDGGAPISEITAENQKKSSIGIDKPGPGEEFGSGTTAILTSPPPGPDSQIVTPSVQPSVLNTASVSTSTTTSSKSKPKSRTKSETKVSNENKSNEKDTTTPAWRKNPPRNISSKTTTTSSMSTGNGSNDSTKETKPHPIQGGRKGPIGLANPPPIVDDIETKKDDIETKKKQMKAKDMDKDKDSKVVSNPEPRVRKEIRVREGGATDMSSLASRVKNLVIANTGGASQSREKKNEGV